MSGVSTKELRAKYEEALRTELHGAGFVRRRGEYWWPLPGGAGDARLLIGISSTYGRLTTFVNIAVTSTPFEALVREVIGEQLHHELQDYTLSLPVKSLNGPPRPKDVRWRALWPPERALLEVEDPTDIADTVEIVVSVWHTFVRPYVEAFTSLVDLAEEHRFMDRGRIPLALHLLGCEQDLSDALDELSLQPDVHSVQLRRAYIANLHRVPRLSNR